MPSLARSAASRGSDSRSMCWSYLAPHLIAVPSHVFKVTDFLTIKCIPTADYVDASSALDTAARPSDLQGRRSDIQREFWRNEAIRAWIDKKLLGARVKMTVVKFVERYGDVILTAKIGRESDIGSIPNPLVPTFYFNVRDGKISQLILIILRNK
jgi:hypothetical protein